MRARSFEVGAAAYDRVRPQFPDAVFQEVISAAGDRLVRGVLEIGAGTGRATLPLARRGVTVLATDPSAQMLQVLDSRLAAEGLHQLVALRQTRFEDVSTSEGPFGVVIAAQSFHWADPQSRWSRLAALLAPDGLAFLLWNGWQLDPVQHDLHAVRAVYDLQGTGLVPETDDHRGQASWVEHEVADHPGLEIAAATTHQWSVTLPVSDYLDLLATTSQYAITGAEDRHRLFGSLRPVLGNAVQLQGQTLLLTISRPPTPA